MKTKTTTLEKSIYNHAVKSYKDIVNVIALLGYDLDGNYLETPERCARALLNDFVYPKKEIERQSKKLLSKAFNADCDEMVIETNIPVISLCPHHLLPVEMKVNIGYIPNKKVVGLSKLPRLAKLFGKQPILQEKYTTDLAKFIFEELGAKGVGVYIIGKHGCMRFRGVNVPESNTITSHLVGNFKTLASTRTEFLSLCQHAR